MVAGGLLHKDADGVYSIGTGGADSVSPRATFLCKKEYCFPCLAGRTIGCRSFLHGKVALEEILCADQLASCSTNRPQAQIVSSKLRLCAP